MSFKGGPGGDLGGTEVTTTATGSFGGISISDTGSFKVISATENSTTPPTPTNGAGGLLYTKDDGKPYWLSNEVSETDLSAGGGGISHDGSTANGVLTFKDSDEATVESKALIDGAKLTIGDGTAEDTLLVFDGNAADFRIGIDDDSDTLEIGAGAAHDTTAAVVIDGSGHVVKIGQDSPSGGQFLKWDGSKAVWDAAGGSDTFIISDNGAATANLTSGSYFHKANTMQTGDNDYTQGRAFATFEAYAPTFTYGYFNAFSIPVSSSLTSYVISGWCNGGNGNPSTVNIWRHKAPTHNSAETDTPSLERVATINLEVAANKMFNVTDTLSSDNVYGPNDQYFITFRATDAGTTSDLYWTMTSVFTVN